jgi:hypothetical protein
MYITTDQQRSSLTAAAPFSSEQRSALYRDGIVGLPGCFPTSWADALHADFDAAFTSARSYPGGTVNRGPNRYYFAVHPEAIRGFLDVVTHSAITSLCTEVLGPDYQIVELGFDVPLAGAKDQPWHRDFPMPEVTRTTGRIDSLAFNLTTVDVTADLAPFEVAPGTHFDDGSGFDHEMFPKTEAYGRYFERASRRHPKRGDVSARTGLTIHRGTENHSQGSRAVLILGVVADDLDPAATEIHQLHFTRGYFDALPADVRPHLRRSAVVDHLDPIIQKHDIEGLMMGG